MVWHGVIMERCRAWPARRCRLYVCMAVGGVCSRVAAALEHTNGMQIVCPFKTRQLAQSTPSWGGCQGPGWACMKWKKLTSLVSEGMRRACQAPSPVRSAPLSRAPPPPPHRCCRRDCSPPRHPVPLNGLHPTPSPINFQRFAHQHTIATQIGTGIQDMPLEPPGFQTNARGTSSAPRF